MLFQGCFLDIRFQYIVDRLRLFFGIQVLVME